MARSRGAFLLSRTGQTQDEIASHASVSRVAVSQWMNGATKPGKKKREVLSDVYGIAEEAWDEEHAPRDSVRVPSSAPRISSEEIPAGVLPKAAKLEEMALRLMTELQDDPESPPLERAKVMSSVAQTLNLLAKLTGQFDLGAQLFQLPTWKNIEAALERALDKHPAAARDVAEELRKLDGAEALTFDRKLAS